MRAAQTIEEANMSADPNEPVFRTIRAVCQRLGGLHVLTVERLAENDPDFPSLTRIGGKNFIAVSALNAYVAKKQGEAQKQPAE